MNRLTFLFVIMLLLLAVPVSAQEGTRVVTDDEVNAIAKKLYCPVCENIPLDACATAACQDWRYEIRLQLEAGKTEQEIIDDFVLRFGDRVVGTPQDPLLRALSLITPWVLVIGGLGVVAATFLSWRRRLADGQTDVQPEPRQPSGDDYDSLLERDLMEQG